MLVAGQFIQMSAIGPKRTWLSALQMSALGGKADSKLTGERISAGHRCRGKLHLAHLTRSTPCARPCGVAGLAAPLMAARHVPPAKRVQIFNDRAGLFVGIPQTHQFAL
jgi:hypothetical protein